MKAVITGSEVMKAAKYYINAKARQATNSTTAGRGSFRPQCGSLFALDPKMRHLTAYKPLRGHLHRSPASLFGPASDLESPAVVPLTPLRNDRVFDPS
jgi:hypothetical protein